MNRKTLFLSLISGALLFLSFPKFNFGFLAWISLVPLLVAFKEKRPYDAFRIGLITGLIYNIGIIYWIAFVVVHYGHLPLYLGIIVMFLLAFYLSLYMAVFSAGVVFSKKAGFPEIISAPVLFTCLEYAKSHLFTGFPWENLACSQYKIIPLIQIADVTGIYGITFLVVLINCVVYDFIISKKKMLPELIAVSVVILAVFVYGTFRVNTVEGVLENIEPTNVLLVQGNIDQSLKWDLKYRRDTLETYKDLSSASLTEKTKLLVWPETAAPLFFQNVDDEHREILDMAKKADSYFLFGSPSFGWNNEKRVFMNSAYLVSPKGDISGRYDKTHLVPFGEYVPLSRWLFFIDKMVEGVGDFAAGKEVFPLSMGDNKLGVLICYEGIFPEISRKYKKNGAELLVSITNDAWFGRTSAPYQHMTMTVFRAVENRLYVIRAANTGISSIISPTGEILSETGLFERATLRGSVRFMRLNTIYSVYGDIFVYMCYVSLLFIFATLLIRRKRND
jgi:apolipoprotein N-acyltransferase